MAFPWLQEETWDDGSRGNFDSETDASSILDFPDLKTLALAGLSPWRGSHALRLQLSGVATANITETGGFDTALGGTIHIWFPILIAENVTLTDGDAVILFALQSAGPVNEAVIGLDRSGSDYRLFCGETGATRTQIITRSNRVWHQVELSATIDSGAGNDGTLDFYVDGGQVGAQIGTLDQAAIAQAMVGAISGTAAGNAGTILIGGIIADDARVYPRRRFFHDTVWVTRDINAWVGPVTLDAVQLTGTSTDGVMALYDTDIFTSTGTDFTREPKVYIRNVVANDQSPGFNTPVEFQYGVYAQLTGTNPQAWISITRPSAPVLSAEHYVRRGLSPRIRRW